MTCYLPHSLGSPPTWYLQHFILDVMSPKYSLLLASMTWLHSFFWHWLLFLRLSVLKRQAWFCLVFLCPTWHTTHEQLLYASVPSTATYKLAIPKLYLLQTLSTCCWTSPPGCLTHTWSATPKQNVSLSLGFLLAFPPQFLLSSTTWFPNLQHVIHSCSSGFLQETFSLISPLQILLYSGPFILIINLTFTFSFGSFHHL